MIGTRLPADYELLAAWIFARLAGTAVAWRADRGDSGVWLGLGGEDDAVCRVGGVGPGLFDVGQWHRPRVDVEDSVSDLLG
jgi:hypothetical protein